MHRRIHVLPKGKEAIRRTLVLLFLAAMSVVGARYIFKTNAMEASAPRLGFLVKSGNEYLLAWKVFKDDQESYSQKKFGDLSTALSFAKDSLNLHTARNPISELELEHLWVQDRFGRFQVLWKTMKVNMLHRLSFDSKTEAEFFAQAFKSGAYTPSPFGHSLLLLPIRS